MSARQREMRGWEKIIEWLASTRLGAWYYIHLATPLDRWLIPVSKGRLSTTLTWPALLLTTTGAKSGGLRTTPLLYVRDGNALVLIASNGGRSRHPAWYYNLRAHPEVSVFLNQRTALYTAREATGDERARLWRKAVDLYAGYETYQCRTGGRQIPVVALVPTTP